MHISTIIIALNLSLALGLGGGAGIENEKVFLQPCSLISPSGFSQMPLHSRPPHTRNHTFHFGLGLSQPLLELLLEEQSLQSLLVVVNPVDRASSMVRQLPPAPGASSSPSSMPIALTCSFHRGSGQRGPSALSHACAPRGGRCHFSLG